MTTAARRAFLVYACAFGIAGVTPFLLLPVLTQRLSPTQFGQVTSFLVLTALLANIASLSAHGFVSVKYFKVAAGEFPAIVSSSMATMGATHLAALAGVLVSFPVVAHLLGLSLGYTLLALMVAFFLNLNLLFLAIFQSSGQPLLYLKARALQGATELTLCLALLFLVFADARARIYSYGAAIACSAVLGFFYVARRGLVGRSVERTSVKGLLQFGVPMLPHIIAGSAITYMDRLVVSSLLGPESLGIYMVGMQIGMAMIALIEPMNKALAPWLFEQLSRDTPDARREVVRRTYQLFAGLMAVGTIVSLGALLLFGRFIDAKYTAARGLIPFMVAGYVFQGMYYAVVNYMFYSERTGRLSMITGSIAFVGVVISYALTSAYGLAGAGTSFVVNNGLLFLVVWFAASRAVPMPWKPGKRRE
jgi:O-antigen/teichoic acid export membrane protein